MPRYRTHLLLSLLTAFLLVGTLAANAEIVIYRGDDDLPKAGNLPPATAGQIKVNDCLVFDLPGGGGGVPLAVRAEILDTRITEILSSGHVGPIFVGDVRGKPTIWVDNWRLITVYPEDAAAKGMTMLDLAHAWAERVRVMLLKCSPAVGPSLEETQAGVPAPPAS